MSRPSGTSQSKPVRLRAFAPAMRIASVPRSRRVRVMGASVEKLWPDGVSAFHSGGRSLEHEPAARLPAARADLDDVVGHGDGGAVVLHHHDRAGQARDGVEQPSEVGVVQADGRLVEHVQEVLEPAGEDDREAGALGFPATGWASADRASGSRGRAGAAGVAAVRARAGSVAPA